MFTDGRSSSRPLNTDFVPPFVVPGWLCSSSPCSAFPPDSTNRPWPDIENSIAAGTITAPSLRSTTSERSASRSHSSSDNTGASYRKIGAMSSSLVADRGRARHERTFVGTECAVCEEPLEHTLRGERILQFSCGHVAHGACFYEFIQELDGQHCPTCGATLHLDTTRGGNVLDIGTRELLSLEPLHLPEGFID